MKIIRHGQKNLERVYRIYCSCGCIYEFTSDDPAIKERLDYTEPRRHYIECPDCRHRFYFTNINGMLKK